MNFLFDSLVKCYLWKRNLSLSTKDYICFGILCAFVSQIGHFGSPNIHVAVLAKWNLFLQAYGDVLLNTSCFFLKEWLCYGQKNHLSGLRRSYLKISFDTVQQLMTVKNDLLHIVERNRTKMEAAEAYESILMVKR